MPRLTDSEILKKVKEYLEKEISNDNGFQYWEACSYLLSKITKWENDRVTSQDD